MTAIVILSVIIIIFVAGQLFEALLEPLYEKYPWVKKVMQVYPTPYNVMRLYARVGDTDGFTRTHAMTGAAFFAIMIFVGFFAWWADQQVLYGLEYVASRDHHSALWQSIGIATILQAMLIFNGGMTVKIWINGLRKDPDHNVQFKINAVLFGIAFASTFALSLMTYYIAKAKGIKAEKIVTGEISQEVQTELKALNEEIVRWENMLKRDSTAVQTAFEAAAGAVQKNADSYASLKKAQIQTGAIDKAYATTRVENMNIYTNTQIQKAAAERDKKMQEVLDKYNPHIADLQKQRADVLKKGTKEKDKTGTDLAMDVETNAATTMGKNVILNVIAFFFNLGLQFFVRGANKENPRKRTKGSNDVKIPKNSGGGFGSGSNRGNKIPIPTPENQTDADNDMLFEAEAEEEIFEEAEGPEAEPEDDVAKKIKKAVIKNKSGGGSLEINRNIEHQILPDGSVAVLYRGQKKDEWWTWNQYMYAIKNRINKFQKVAAPEARENQLEWIRLFESRLDFIEAMHGAKKPLPKRIPFDPKNPNRKIFGV